MRWRFVDVIGRIFTVAGLRDLKKNTVLCTKENMYELIKYAEEYDVLMNAFFAGIVICLSVISLIQYNLNKDIFFLFFFLFLVSLLISLDDLSITGRFNYIFGGLAFLFYVLCIDEALLISKGKKRSRRFSTYVSVYTIFYLITMTIIELGHFNMKYVVTKAFMVSMLIIIAIV
ncbi:MAG: hypothetical protein HC892_10165 [Saprospiraceae bacterium]|nr:hypothetical protein [Saprospiraceae bacterium]